MSKNSFKDKVNTVVKEIPCGKTLSYKAVASRAGFPRAARAVAQIMASNYDKSVPCHRVIRSDGTVGGYNRGGEKAKRAILEIEGAI